MSATLFRLYDDAEIITETIWPSSSNTRRKSMLQSHTLQAGARIAGWKCDAKGGAETGRARDAYVARMLLHDAVSHGQPQAGAAADAFSSKEWIINLYDVFGSYANAVITHFDRDQTVVITFSGREHNPAVTIGDRIARVEDQVGKDLLELD